MLEIKEVLIKQYYTEIESMMGQLQDVENSLYNRSETWSQISTAYMSYMIECQNDEEGVCFIAFWSQKPIGFIFGYTDSADDSRIDTYIGKELYISDGFVAPDHRKSGIYQQLNDTIEQHYFDKGIRKISRFTLFNNTKIQSFLTKNGYKPIRILYEKWWDESKNTLPLNLISPQ